VGKGVAYCATCDAPLYKDKTVVIVGGGNSAFTTALDLLRLNAEAVVVNFLSGWQADQALQSRVRKFGKVQFLDYHEIVSVEGKDKFEAVAIRDRRTGEEKRIEADGIFVEIGLLPNSDPVKKLVEVNAHGEVVVDCYCRTDIPGLFGAGDVTDVPHKQIIISAGEGAKAALSAYDYLIEKSQI
ncbi:MAG TPA: FAD-dependent oxidoreductase, partial [Thermodesulfovibrionales bacterium]|nr:FAD-dependent oxidoreductase [Thermodesulfovibrionales bacterium]